MNKESVRMFLWMALIMVGFFLYNQWDNLNAAKEKNSEQVSAQASMQKQDPSTADLPDFKQAQKPVKKQAEFTTSSEAENSYRIPENRVVKVKTDVLDLNIDLKGGDFSRLVLPKYPEKIKTPEQGFVLLDSSADRYYVAQSGLLNPFGPDSKQYGRAVYKTSAKSYYMQPADNELTVDLFYSVNNAVDIVKRFKFTRGSYVIGVEYLIANNSSEPYIASFYSRIKRTPAQDSSGFMGMRTYTGAAINTPDKAYLKLPFSDMAKEPTRKSITGGWAAMIEHYFTTAWVPEKSVDSTYSSEALGQNVYGIRYVSDPITVLSGQKQVIKNKFYAGPEITEDLKVVSPGLELTVDYGILWPICQPIFWILKTIYGFVCNWGIAIILTTLVIKLLFYKLSASSYRSMGNMRKLQPRIEALKERYGDDKQGFGQAVMQLYRQEKVNPLGGCLPILVQIPVFIALYYVLLESVELRHAPFFLWIQDLSAKDPYYVLPILMGASMIVQQKLSPAPPDPVQAKVMMAMPIVFTFLFVQFPSGLVLYWVVNNVLSIIQQWAITKKIEAKK